MASRVAFTIGEKFPSYKALESKIQLYQCSNFVQLYKRSSRTIAGAKIRCPRKEFNEDIKYYEVTFSCIHGGVNTFKSKGTGKRNQSTFKMGCKAEIKLVASGDGQDLEVKSINELHNHEVNESIFRNLWQQRKLPELEKENIQSMLSVNADKHMIQQKIMAETGKVVLMKDLHNLVTANSSNNKNLTSLQLAVEELSKTTGPFVQLVSNESDEMRGLFYQDARMKSMFQSYPEFLYVEPTYTVNDLNMPLYLLLVENGNGQSEIVGMWLVAEPSEQLLSEMIHIFQENNSKWNCVKAIVLEKDFVQREVFERMFPDAELRISLFHVLRTFKKELIVEKSYFSKEQKDSILQILQKMCFSETEEEYEANINLMIETGLTAIVEYFMQQWHPIRQQWMSHLLGNKPNNKLDAIIQKIKHIVDNNTKFDHFASDIMKFLQYHRTEIDAKLCRETAKVPVFVVGNEELIKFRQKLTPHAFSLIEEELNLFLTIPANDGTRDDITVDSCTCQLHREYMLPCRHILAERHNTGMPLFADDIIQPRWTRKHFLDAIAEHADSFHDEQSPLPKGLPQSQQQRYRKAFHIAQRLATCAAEETGAGFTLRMAQLQALLTVWETGSKVTLNVASVENKLNDTNIDAVSQEIASNIIDNMEYFTATPASDEIVATASSSKVGTSPNKKKRGRSKDADTAVADIPKKRHKSALKKMKRKAFEQMTPTEKTTVMLTWFVDEDLARACLKSGKRLTKDDITVTANTVNMAATDTNLETLYTYFDTKALQKVLEIVNEASDRIWTCSVCNDYLNKRCIRCDMCLELFHYDCASLKASPKSKYWFCCNC